MLFWLCTKNAGSWNISKGIVAIYRARTVWRWVWRQSIQDIQRWAGQSTDTFESDGWTPAGETVITGQKAAAVWWRRWRADLERKDQSDPVLFRRKIYDSKGSQSGRNLCGYRFVPYVSGRGAWLYGTRWSSNIRAGFDVSDLFGTGLGCKTCTSALEAAWRGGTWASYYMGWNTQRTSCTGDGRGADRSDQAAVIWSLSYACHFWRGKYRLQRNHSGTGYRYGAFWTITTLCRGSFAVGARWAGIRSGVWHELQRRYAEQKLAAFDPNSFAGKETSRSAYRIRDHGYADLRYCR